MEGSHFVSNRVSTGLLVVTVLCLAALGTTAGKEEELEGKYSHGNSGDNSQLQYNYYRGKCPNQWLDVEDVIYSAVRKAFAWNKETMAGVLRMHFHDCFVNGCDGSVLIDSPDSEKTALPNLSLHGFEVIDAAKTAIESVCPGVVSCADILAMASQLAVKELSGNKISWEVPTGRRDGYVSTAASTVGNLPSSVASVADLKANFDKMGLSLEDMVILSGAHSVGVSHCFSFQNRLTNPLDATLDPTFGQQLETQCPAGSNNVVNLDVTTPTKLDEMYFKNLQKKKGLLTSDQNLQNDPSTQPIVAANTDMFTFALNFRTAMIKMGNINVKTGSAGNIRLNCRKFNA